MSSLFKVRLWCPLLVLLVSSFFVSCSSPAGTSQDNRINTTQPANVSSSEKAAGPSKQAWEKEWDKTLAEAKKERQVVIAGGSGMAVAREPFILAMKEKFDIDLEVIIAPGSNATQRIVTERRAGIYRNDIYLGGANTLVDEMMPRNFVQPIEPHFILPEVKDPALWFRGELPVWGTNREAFFSILNITSHVSANTTLVKPEELTSYNDLLKPKLKGKIAMYDPTLGSGGGKSFFSMAYKFMGADYVKGLVKQDLVLTRDIRLMTDWLVSGKVAVGIGLSTGPIKLAEQDGFPVTTIPVFKEGSIVGPGAGQLAIFKDAPHPNAAGIFVNWLLSKEGMTTFAKAVGMASRRVDVSTDHLAASMVPDSKAKYVFESQKSLEEDAKLQPVAIEIFGPLTGR